MKKHLIEEQVIADNGSTPPQDIASFYAESHCPHIERWLPHILETATLPTHGSNEYIVENPIHALHLRAGTSRSNVLYGDEQKRTDSLFRSSGIVDLYIPNRLTPENQNYYSKRVKLDKPRETKDSKKALASSTTAAAKAGGAKSARPSPKPAVKAEAKPKKAEAKVEAKPIKAETKPVKAETKPVKAAAKPIEKAEAKPVKEEAKPTKVEPPSTSTKGSAVPNKATSSSTAAAFKPPQVPSLPPKVVKPPAPPVYEIPEERFQQLRRAENQILLQRRNLFFKRDNKRSKSSSSSSKKSKKRDSSASAKNHEQHHPFILDKNAYDEEARRARDKVETWLQYFRSGRKDFWNAHKNKEMPQAFGSMQQFYPGLNCQECSTTSKESGDALMKCLDCGYVACAPHSLAPDSKQHMILHMLTTNHKLAATCGPRNSLYCFGCGDVVYHPVFDYERERIDLEHTLPEWAWPEHAVQRSFDAFQFVSSKDHGMIWKGLVATFPATVPKQHLKAARMVLQRFKLYDSPTIQRPVGLYNLGNTCFMNSILQCLIHCPPLQSHFLQDVRHDYRTCKLFRGKKTCLACELDHVFVNYFGNSAGEDFDGSLNGKPRGVEIDKGYPLIPSSLLAEAWKQKEMDHLKGYEQRDAHEFLQAFLDIVAKHTKAYEATIQKNLAVANKPPRKTVDIIKHLFEGTLRSVSVCEDCGCKRSLLEPFMNVSLPLSEDSVLKYTSRKMNVQHCLHHFTAAERLSDPIECPSCKKKTPTKKQQTFSRLPKILCLHLKRFDAAKNKKITDFVSFPARGLDMGPLLPHWREVTGGDEDQDDETVAYPKVMYDLFGTVNHRGTLNQGHYVGHVKVDEQWYYCNDAHISTAEEHEVLKSDGAYVLFYVRR